MRCQSKVTLRRSQPRSSRFGRRICWTSNSHSLWAKAIAGRECGNFACVDLLNRDMVAVAAWMSQQRLGEGPIDNVAAIVGGTQNIMLRFTRSGREYVFRRGPQHLRPVSNSVIVRETRVLRALADTDVRTRVSSLSARTPRYSATQSSISVSYTHLTLPTIYSV